MNCQQFFRKEASDNPVTSSSVNDQSAQGVPTPKVDYVPSLLALFEEKGLNEKRLSVALEVDEHRKLIVPERHLIMIHDGEKSIVWTAPPLSELFRGTVIPPADLTQYPPPYCFYFAEIERQLLDLTVLIKDPTDQQMEEIYSSLRRRPDGRSQDIVHASVWQFAAFLLGTYALSAAEFDAIFGQLTRSTRRFSQRPVSRNYLNYLRQMFGRMRE